MIEEISKKEEKTSLARMKNDRTGLSSKYIVWVLMGNTWINWGPKLVNRILK